MENDFKIPATLDRLAVKARDYLDTDPNASIIKQGMMLEYICRSCLNEEGKIDDVPINGRNIGIPTLDEMLEYLYAAGIIPDNSGNRIICEAVRKNRNRAVHEFLDSRLTAISTFEPLCRICRHTHLGTFSFDKKSNEEVSEPQIVYYFGGGWTCSMRFAHCMQDLRIATPEELMAIQREMK